MTECWGDVRDSLKLTLTNVVRNELQQHAKRTPNHTMDGTRDHRLNVGSERVLDAVRDDDVAFSVVTGVPRPHGEDAGEKSLVQEVKNNPLAYRYVVLNDSTYRDKLRDVAADIEADTGASFTVVPPTHLLYFLFDNDEISLRKFCQCCAGLIQGEGWTNIGAITEMWRTIPVDCSGYVSADLLP
jgi:hypothetical protein